MTKIWLLILVVASAIGVVSTQHLSRQLFIDLDKSMAKNRQLRFTRDQLELERLIWASHDRIERIAHNELQMRAPKPEHVWFINAR